MSTLPPQPPRWPRRDKRINRWHRAAGITAGGVLVYLMITGIPLQFTAELGLGHRYVTADWLLDWYGMEAPRQVLQSGEVILVGDQLMASGRRPTTLPTLIGAVEHADFTIVAGADQVLLWHRLAPENVETVTLAGGIRQIGRSPEAVYLDLGSTLLVADPSLLSWKPAPEPPESIQWSRVISLTGADAEPHRQRFRAQMLPVERWLQDLHSGRFFGPIGIMIVDLASLLMLVLAFTGTVMWWRFRRSVATERAR